MKTVSTTVSTGDRITYNGKPARIGIMRKGKITILVSVDSVSGINIQLTTRAINKMINEGSIKAIKSKPTVKLFAGMCTCKNIGEAENCTKNCNHGKEPEPNELSNFMKANGLGEKDMINDNKPMDTQL